MTQEKEYHVKGNQPQNKESYRTQFIAGNTRSINSSYLLQLDKGKAACYITT
jgi:hypothetical protein